MQYFIKSMNNFLEKMSCSYRSTIIILAIILYSWLILFVVLQVIIHEGGHCVFGLLSGYKLISFRVFGFTFLKCNKKISLKKFNIPGSFGQCIMKPPIDKIDNPHFVLFLMGGVIADFVIAIISLIFTFGSFEISFICRCIFLITFIYTFGNALLNGIPRIRGRLNNDGTNLRCFLKDKQAQISGLFLMDINALIQDGYTYKAFTSDKIIVPEEADLTNEVIAWHKILEYYYYLDLRQWDKASECISELERTDRKKSRLMELTEISEKLFLYIILDRNSPDIEALHNKIKKVLIRKDIDFNLTRVQMAYELFRDSSVENQIRIRKELIKKTAEYPYKGEALFCSGLIEEMLD